MYITMYVCTYICIHAGILVVSFSFNSILINFSKYQDLEKKNKAFLNIIYMNIVQFNNTNNNNNWFDYYTVFICLTDDLLFLSSNIYSQHWTLHICQFSEKLCHSGKYFLCCYLLPRFYYTKIIFCCWWKNSPLCLKIKISLNNISQIK